MPHEYAGHYAAKHPRETAYDPALAAALEESAVDARLSCSTAHRLAGEFDVPPSEIGKTADLLELRIVECQMGLFGYSPEKRTVRPAETVSDGLRDRLQASAGEGRIDCVACWTIARELGIGKMDVSCACERLGLKVKNCQIGAF